MGAGGITRPFYRHAVLAGPLVTSSGFFIELVVNGFWHQRVEVFFSFLEGAERSFVQKLL